MPTGVTIELTTGDLVLYGIPFIIVIGWVSSRLLGVRRGWGRSFVAGLFGWSFGVTIAALVQDTDVRNNGQLENILPLALFFGVLVSMLVGLVLDVLLKPRQQKHRRLRWLVHPIATLKRRLAPFGRFREILRYARKRGLQHYASASKLASPEFARRLRLTLEDCGGMFVKFGQIASTRGDLLPDVLTAELEQLQSSARQVDADDVRDVLERELGASVEEEFASFDFEPLAAASIGQTHRAVLKTGEHVVVKVQRPGIEEVVERDAAVLRMAAGVADRRVEAARQLGVKRLADELIGSLERELDYSAEAASGIAFLDHLGDEVGIAAPKVYEALSTRRVLVMEEVPGVTVADRDAIAAVPESPDELARRLLRSFLDQVLRDGLYHADPHPGNVFVDPTACLWFLDFGAVGRLSPLVLESLQEMAIGFELNDPVVLARATTHLAGGDEGGDSRALEADIGLVLTEGLGSGSFDPQAMSLMLEVMHRHGLEVPGAMTVLSRALLTLEGTLRTIDPGFNIAREATALLPDLAGERSEMLQEELQKEVARALPSLRTLPGHVEAIATQLRGGRLTMRTERYAGSDREVVDEWVDRAIFAAVGLVGLLGSALLLVAAAVVHNDDNFATALQVIGFAGIIITSVMQMRVVAQIFRRGDEHGRRTV